MPIKNNSLKIKGFTVMELLVAATVFSILIAVASGAFIKTLRTQRAIVNLIAVNDNLSVALEQMIREIRTGFDFSLVGPAELQFVNADNFVVRYRLNGGAIERGPESAFFVFDYRKITADNVIVSNFNIGLFGHLSGDGFPPRITISLLVTPAHPSLSNIIIPIQSTVSARIIDT